MRRDRENLRKGAERVAEAEDVLLRPASLEDLGGWLRRRREQRGMTLDGLMEKTGISKPYLSNIETGRAPGAASEDKLRRIAKVLGVSADMVAAAGDWLRTPESVRRLIGDSGARMGGETAKGRGGEPAKGGSGEAAIPRRGDGSIDLDSAMRGRALETRELKVKNRAEEIPVRAVPLINRVAAGRASEYTDLDYPRGVADEYVPVADLPEFPVASAFGVKVVGDSMMPEYAEGEILIVAPVGEGDDALRDGDDCVVRLGEEENFATTFKRVFFVRDESGRVTAVRLVALNPAYAERVVAMERVSGIYPVLWRMKAGRRGSGAEVAG